MAQINWTKNNDFYIKSTGKVNSVSRKDWLGFLEALGEMESDGTYNAINSAGYSGMYQFY